MGERSTNLPTGQAVSSHQPDRITSKPTQNMYTLVVDVISLFIHSKTQTIVDIKLMTTTEPCSTDRNNKIYVPPSSQQPLSSRPAARRSPPVVTCGSTLTTTEDHHKYMYLSYVSLGLQTRAHIRVFAIRLEEQLSLCLKQEETQSWVALFVRRRGVSSWVSSAVVDGAAGGCESYRPLLRMSTLR